MRIPTKCAQRDWTHHTRCAVPCGDQLVEVVHLVDIHPSFRVRQASAFSGWKSLLVIYELAGAGPISNVLATFLGGLLGLQRLPGSGALHGTRTALLLLQTCGFSLGLGKLRGCGHVAEYTSDASGVRPDRTGWSPLRYLRANVISTWMRTATGFPSRRPGVNNHCFMAETACSSSPSFESSEVALAHHHLAVRAYDGIEDHAALNTCVQGLGRVVWFDLPHHCRDGHTVACVVDCLAIIEPLALRLADKSSKPLSQMLFEGLIELGSCDLEGSFVRIPAVVGGLAKPEDELAHACLPPARLDEIERRVTEAVNQTRVSAVASPSRPLICGIALARTASRSAARSPGSQAPRSYSAKPSVIHRGVAVPGTMSNRKWCATSCVMSPCH